MSPRKFFPLLLVPIVSGVFAYAETAKRGSKCYRLDDRGLEHVDAGNHILCVTSSDLKLYPKSVVTISLFRTEGFDSEKPAAGTPGTEAAPKPGIHTLARRHYSMLAEGEFGRRSGSGKPKLIFNPDGETVFVGFLSEPGKTYFYKPISEDLVMKSRALRQRLPSGKRDGR